MRITILKGFMSPMPVRNQKVSESNKIENLLRKQGWKIEGSNMATIEVMTGRDLVHVMEELRQIGFKEDLIISGWA